MPADGLNSLLKCLAGVMSAIGFREEGYQDCLVLQCTCSTRSCSHHDVVCHSLNNTVVNADEVFMEVTNQKHWPSLLK